MIETTLPPDPDGMNDARAVWAQAAVDTFARETNMNTAGEAPATILGDLLGDLMHWANRVPVDFDDALRTARMHYAVETQGEEP